MGRFFAVGFCGLYSWGAFSQTAVVTKTSAEELLWITKGSSTIKVEINGDRPLCWSTDARWLVIGQKQKSGLFSLKLIDTTSPIPVPLSLSGESSLPSWSPNGRQFVVETAGQGMRIADCSGSEPKWSLWFPSGHLPNWSPNGGRIAFTGDSKSPGIWVSDVEGTHLSKIEGQTSANRIAWSPDGRNLAISRQNRTGLELVVMTRSGVSQRVLGTVISSPISWAPSGTSILAKRNDGWAEYNLKSGQWHKIGSETLEMAQWENSQTISGLNQGQPVRVSVTKGDINSYWNTKPKELPETEMVSFLAYQGITLDGKMNSPFGELKAPMMGHVRLTGIISDIDLENDTVVLAVDSVIYPNGNELNLSQPQKQTLRVTTASSKQVGLTFTQLEATDFIQEGEVSVTATADKLDASQEFGIINCMIPELSVAPLPVLPTNSRTKRTLDYDGVSSDLVTVPLIFPVCGKVSYEDSFLASRGGGSRRHHGQDLMAPKMRPLVAVFDGTIRFNHSSAGHNTIVLKGDDGWTAVYMHVNNDHPGTDDGAGGNRFAFAPGLNSGDRVTAGQLVGFCGDSGNAESTAPHCHFELHDDIGGGVLNAFASLSQSTHIALPNTINPMPDLSCPQGKTRWDLVVTKIDKEQKVLIGELISNDSGSGLQTNLSPKIVYIKISGKTMITLRKSQAETREFESIKPGVFVTAFGVSPSPDSGLDAEKVFIGNSIRD